MIVFDSHARFYRYYEAYLMEQELVKCHRESKSEIAFDLADKTICLKFNPERGMYGWSNGTSSYWGIRAKNATHVVVFGNMQEKEYEGVFVLVLPS